MPSATGPQIIPVVMSNRTTRLIATPEQLVRLKRYFAFEVPGARFTPKYKLGLWDGFISLLRSSRVPTGLFLDRVKAIIEAGEFGFTMNQDQRVRPSFQQIGEYDLHLIELIQGKYAFQGVCVGTMIKAACTGGLVLAATGTGKTNTAGLFFACLQGHGLFIVDELTLLEQAHRGISAVLQQENIGWVGDGYVNLQRITITTAQSLQRHLDDPKWRLWLQLQEVAIIDEIHTMVNARTEEVIKAMPNLKAVFGLTATLELDKPHVRYPAVALCGPPIFKYPLQQATAEGVLSQSVVVLLKFQNDYNGGVGGRFKNPQQEYDAAISHNEIRNNLIESLCREGIKRGMKVVCLVRARKHLRELSDRFDKGEGLYHAALCGLNSRRERIEAQRAMERGGLRLIIASEIFAKGVNIKNVSLIIDATAAPSTNAAQQRHGRGTRKKAGKRGLIHIDIADYGRIRFEEAATLRAKALRSLGVPIITLKHSDVVQVLDAAQKRLKGV